MTCRRAFEIDLPAFLLEPRDPAWHGFRAHYPLCPDCSAELAVWTALQDALAARHPEPAELLRWSDDPDALEPEPRAALARHLDQCASCRDELRALDGFAEVRARAGAESSATPAYGATAWERGAPTSRRARNGTTRAAAAAPRRDASRRSALGVARRVLWHPALAYAVLALVLLLPTFRARFDEDAGSRAFQEAPAGGGPPAAARPEQAVAPEQPVFMRKSFDVRGEADDVAPRPQAAAPAPAERAAEPLVDAAGDARVERERRSSEQPRAAPGAEAARAKSAPAPATASKQLAAPGVAALGGATPTTAALVLHLQPLDASGARVLVVVPPGTAGGDAVEVLVRDQSGAREIRERLRPSPGSGTVTLDLPRTWRDTSTVIVEVYRVSGELLARDTVTAP